MRDDTSLKKLEHLSGNIEIKNEANCLLRFNTDLVIYPNFNTRTDNVSALGYSYKKPDGIDPYSDEAIYFLNHGIDHFKVEELEVLKVELKIQ